MSDYITEGYNLMTAYITENRIKTRNRKFLRKLDKFYEKYNNKNKQISIEEEKEYLKLEKEFYTTILPAPDNAEDKASLEVLNILTQANSNEEE